MDCRIVCGINIMSKMSYWKIMTRRKPMPVEEECDESKLSRVFGTFDLTALGVGATLGQIIFLIIYLHFEHF